MKHLKTQVVPVVMLNSWLMVEIFFLVSTSVAFVLISVALT